MAKLASAERMFEREERSERWMNGFSCCKFPHHLLTELKIRYIFQYTPQLMIVYLAFPLSKEVVLRNAFTALFSDGYAVVVRFNVVVQTV